MLPAQLYRCADNSVLINLNKLQTEEAGQDATVCVPCSLCAVVSTGPVDLLLLLHRPRRETRSNQKQCDCKALCAVRSVQKNGRNFVLTSIVQFSILQSWKYSFHRKLKFFYLHGFRSVDGLKGNLFHFTPKFKYLQT